MGNLATNDEVIKAAKNLPNCPYYQTSTTKQKLQDIGNVNYLQLRVLPLRTRETYLDEASSIDSHIIGMDQLMEGTI